MREKIDTIPIHEAFHSGDECPFCYLEREAEHRAIKYTIGPGASYMEPEIRAITDREGFCRHHFKMMYEYKNTLGCALILQTYYNQNHYKPIHALKSSVSLLLLSMRSVASGSMLCMISRICGSRSNGAGAVMRS